MEDNIIKLSDNWWFHYMLEDDGSQGLCFGTEEDTIYIKELELKDDDKFFARHTFGYLKDEEHEIFVTKEFHRELMKSLRNEQNLLRQKDPEEMAIKIAPIVGFGKGYDNYVEEKKKQIRYNIHTIDEELEYYKRMRRE